MTDIKEMVLKVHNDCMMEQGGFKSSITDVSIYTTHRPKNFFNRHTHINNGVYSITNGIETSYEIHVKDFEGDIWKYIVDVITYENSTTKEYTIQLIG